MATGDTIIKYGSYATCQAASSPANGAMSAGAVTNLTTAIPSEKDYVLLDFQVVLGAGATAGNTVDIYRKPSDQSAPSATFKSQYAGSVVVNTGAGNYYLRGVPNSDPADTFYCWNATGATVSIELKVRGRTYVSAP